MDGPLLYLAQPRSGVPESLARREFAWLIKNQLYDTEQVGWSFSHGQVNRCPPYTGKSLIENLSSGDIDTIQEVIRKFRNEDVCFVVPLIDEIGIKTVAHRTAALGKIGVISDVESPTVDLVGDVGEFWQNQSSSYPSVYRDSSNEVRALFNIAHPYDLGPFFDGEEQQQYELRPDGWKHTNSQGPVCSAHFAFDLEAENPIDEIFQRIWSLGKRLPKGSRMDISSHTRLDPDFEFQQGDEYQIEGNTITLNSGAVSSGSVILSVENGVNREETNELLRRCNSLGLSLAGEFSFNSTTAFLLKLHPIHTDTPKPRFKPDRERRKLAQTEWARDEVPGYKKISTFESTPREHCIAEIDGKRIVVKRTSGEGGRGKDADDFMWAIGDEEPTLFSVFQDTQRALACEDSGMAFLDAIYRIWDAEWKVKELPTEVPRLFEELPPNSNSEDMRYGRLPLLWIYALQFIVEDINYRFNFHPVRFQQNLIKYRKQGRDQPMNIVLHIAALNPSEERLSELTDSTKGQSSDVPRPGVAGGYEHLVPWFEDKNLISSINKDGSGVPAKTEPTELSDYI